LLAVFPLISGVGEFSVCCEKTKAGAWCQNSEENNCNTDYRSVPTSCEATSYCKLGTCINNKEGNCMENTPERVCNDEGGVWQVGDPEDIPQCQLGCCLVGDQAAFVTQTRCKRLSSLYSLETNFNTGISNEVECIASASSEVKGACVYDREFEKTCEFTTKRECQNLEANPGERDNIEFYEGRLCSATELGTNCGPRGGTTCVDGKDEVYFLDTCGNLANIYDYSKIEEETYWSEVTEPSCSSDNSGNADSRECGDCNYFLGSTCKEYQRSEDKESARYGDNICRDLSCEFEGEDYEHGETWCADSAGVDENLPGSRYFRMLCYNGDVTVEPCADFRQETCIQSEVNDFSTAACRVNMWQDCTVQDDQKDCENIDRRDCVWISGDRFDDEKRSDEDEQGSCVPANSPGLDFWNSESDSETLCAIASDQCVVKFIKEFKSGGVSVDLTPEWKCDSNCECLGLEKGDKRDYSKFDDSEWVENKNSMCLALGDCGSVVNYIGIEGYHNESSLAIDGKEYDPDQNSEGRSFA